MLNLLNFLIAYDFIIPKSLLLIFSLIICKHTISCLIKDPYPNGYEPFDIFKIKNFILNYLLVFIYISIFILLLFALRMYRIGFQLDLKPFYHFILFFVYQKEFLLSLITILFIVNFIFIFIIGIKYLKLVLELHILRQHLYLSYPHNNEYIKKFLPFYYSRGYTNIYRLCLYIFKKFNYYTLLQFIKFNLYKLISMVEHYKFFVKILIKLEQIVLNFLKPKIMFIFLVLLILYDILFNDSILQTIYYILPYYFIFSLWYKLSLFLRVFHDPLLNEIIFDIYYKNAEILYLNITDDEIMLIATYIRNGLLWDEPSYWQNSNKILPILINKKIYIKR